MQEGNVRILGSRSESVIGENYLWVLKCGSVKEGLLGDLIVGCITTSGRG